MMKTVISSPGSSIRTEAAWNPSYTDDEHLALRPQYHWTDQKIHVHAFILATIRLAMTLSPARSKGGRPRADWQLELADPQLAHLFRGLVPNKPPFVYTDGST